jgi:hypothetical protein
MVTGLGKHDIILGPPWLERHNLDINWKTGEFLWRKDPLRKVFQKVSIKEEEDDQAWMNQTVNALNNSEHILKEINLLETTQVYKELVDNDLLVSFIKGETYQEMDNIWKQLEEEEELKQPSWINAFKAWEVKKNYDGQDNKGPPMGPVDYASLKLKPWGYYYEQENEMWINAKPSESQKLAQQYDIKPDQEIHECIPKEYHEYLNVFNEQKADRFPLSPPWDHEIKIKPGFEPRSQKAYNLTLEV